MRRVQRHSHLSCSQVYILIGMSVAVRCTLFGRMQDQWILQEGVFGEMLCNSRTCWQAWRLAQMTEQGVPEAQSYSVSEAHIRELFTETVPVV